MAKHVIRVIPEPKKVDGNCDMSNVISFSVENTGANMAWIGFTEEGAEIMPIYPETKREFRGFDNHYYTGTLSVRFEGKKGDVLIVKQVAIENCK
jgi:hypothetical protein